MPPYQGIMSKRRVGIVGYGKLGQFLVKQINDNPDCGLEVGFVWNRSIDRVYADESVSNEIVLADLNEFEKFLVDIIVEVAHPSITRDFGQQFLTVADYFVGSPTVFADQTVEDAIRAAVRKHGHGCYIPAGALWGASDIQKMADRQTIGGLTITMKKEPSSLKVFGTVEENRSAYVNSESTAEIVLYEGKTVMSGAVLTIVLVEGPVRGLCPLAPNNVNTMACAALAAHTLGFDGVKARLCADKTLNAHVIDIEVFGKGDPHQSNVFKVSTNRYNPSQPGAVTGSATYISFYSSLVAARNLGCGMHFC